MKYNVDKNGYYGDFEEHIPEMLYPNINELKENYLKIISESQFKKDFNLLLKKYVGRPTLVFC